MIAGMPTAGIYFYCSKESRMEFLEFKERQRFFLDNFHYSAALFGLF